MGRPVAEARAVYDRLAPVYDVAAGMFEGPARQAGLRLLAVRAGERVLEIGCGTGHALAVVARQAGETGLAVGVDLSARMAAAARRRHVGAGAPGRAALVQAEAARLPLRDGRFDAVTMSFVLELMDAPEMPVVLAECGRVLAPGGRLAVVSLLDVQPPPLMARLYLLARRRMARLLDCRPIPLRDALVAAGFEVTTLARVSVGGLPAAAALAAPA